MSGYEEEHNITRPTTTTDSNNPRRPDLSSFFSALELTNNASTSASHNNGHGPEPLPANVSAAYRMLANALQVMTGETEGVAIDHGFDREAVGRSGLLDGMIETLMMGAERPPREVDGMSDEFFAELDRVPKARLTKDQTCPICSLPFLDDPYPLVVRLPCHKDHLFDMDCIRPWLKLKTTCPLDRVDLKPKKKEIPKPAIADDEEEYDDMYA